MLEITEKNNEETISLNKIKSIYSENIAFPILSIGFFYYIQQSFSRFMEIKNKIKNEKKIYKYYNYVNYETEYDLKYYEIFKKFNIKTNNNTNITANKKTKIKKTVDEFINKTEKNDVIIINYKNKSMFNFNDLFVNLIKTLIIELPKYKNNITIIFNYPDLTSLISIKLLLLLNYYFKNITAYNPESNNYYSAYHYIICTNYTNKSADLLKQLITNIKDNNLFNIEGINISNKLKNLLYDYNSKKLLNQYKNINNFIVFYDKQDYGGYEYNNKIDEQNNNLKKFIGNYMNKK